MKTTVLIPLYDDEVAPRFDLATEVLIADYASGKLLQEKILILPGASAERLCQMVITEGVQVVICGAIEQEFYDYLAWKRVRLIDNVIGSGRLLLERFLQGRLSPGDILR